MAAAIDTQRAQQQLAAIASLDTSLQEHDIEYWLFGGWAVDFWVGSVTRDHDDIDVAAWQSDKDAIRTALLSNGWQHTPAAGDVVATRYQLHGMKAEFTFVVRGSNDEVLRAEAAKDRADLAALAKVADIPKLE
jgi:hypothetical protein